MRCSALQMRCAPNKLGVLSAAASPQLSGTVHHEVTRRRPTLQLRCLAGRAALPAAPDFAIGGLADWTVSGLPGWLLPLLLDALKPAAGAQTCAAAAVMHQNELK